jgi:hypothetical protein
VSTIRLKGGRGTVTLRIVHMNPNYVFGIDANGSEVTVPQLIIDSIAKG